MRRFHVTATSLLLVCWSCLCAAGDSGGLFEVRVQLKWFHQFQSAGFYAAIEKGYFRDAGLNVTLLEGGPDINPTEQVLSGDAEFGVGTSGLLITRSHGLPIVAVAAIFQHSPYALIVRDDPAILTPRDLEGKTIMVEPYSQELIAYLNHVGVDVSAVNMIEHTGSPLDIFDGEIVGMTAYSTTEPYLLRRLGRRFRVFDPKFAGVDFYGDTVFTTESFVQKHNDYVIAFRNALIRGWQYALQNKEETIDLIRHRYKPRADIDMLSFEASVIQRLLAPDLVQIGYMNPDRWHHIAHEFSDADLLERNVDIDEFLFRPDENNDWLWLFYILLVSFAVIMIFAGVLAKFYTLNRSLKVENAKRIELQEELEQLAITDHLTGVLNRRGFMEAVQRELVRSNRNQSPLSLLELDLDLFKQVNDTCGHAAGDEALFSVSSICRKMLRGIDVIGRMGGEEFMIALSDTTLEGARNVAERIRREVEMNLLRLEDGTEVTLTVSIGVIGRRSAEDIDAMMERADEAMYRAKHSGRNTVCTDK